MSEKLQNDDLVVNGNLRETWLRVAGSQMSKEQLEAATKHLDSLSIGEQNSKLNIVLTYLADARTRGL